ncbi:hypothetical protein FSB08_20230 [Paraburkholderia sp. JPY432]|uniref:hypothetical protein n=1 Tax=Paraburkholderia youngii TaxID=2782701 RepID=UPI001594EB4E|nr:hypothetical protein [Paraburkholderia youngii]NVH74797.1 hypothetical protein [Paraburkholderia youngii]
MRQSPSRKEISNADVVMSIEALERLSRANRSRATGAQMSRMRNNTFGGNLALWLVRAGKHGQFEQMFLQQNRVYLTWDSLNVDLGSLTSRDALLNDLRQS